MNVSHSLINSLPSEIHKSFLLYTLLTSFFHQKRIFFNDIYIPFDSLMLVIAGRIEKLEVLGQKVLIGSKFHVIFQKAYVDPFKDRALLFGFLSKSNFWFVHWKFSHLYNCCKNYCRWLFFHAKFRWIPHLDGAELKSYQQK